MWILEYSNTRTMPSINWRWVLLGTTLISRIMSIKYWAETERIFPISQNSLVKSICHIRQNTNHMEENNYFILNILIPLLLVVLECIRHIGEMIRLFNSTIYQHNLLYHLNRIGDNWHSLDVYKVEHICNPVLRLWFVMKWFKMYCFICLVVVETKSKLLYSWRAQVSIGNWET